MDIKNIDINIKKIIAKEGLIFIGFVLLGFLYRILLVANTTNTLRVWRRATLLFYGAYLSIRFIIWAVKTIKEK